MGKVTSIKAKAGGGDGDFEIAPEGVFLARCYRMVDVGTQTTTGQYGTKENRTVYLWWELLQDDDGEEVRMDDGKTPYSIMNSYTLSMHKKANLRKHIDAWRGKALTEDQAEEFDITVLLDKFCKIQVTHSKSKDGERTYANIEAIMTTKKKAKGINEIVSFSIEEPDTDVFNDLPEWLQNKIEDAPEWQDAEEEETPPAKTAKKQEVKEDEIDVEDVPF